MIYGSDCENEYEGHSNDGENTPAELFVRLTDMVRKHYCGYLEKQLLENVQAWRANISQYEGDADDILQPKERAALQECCRVLEDKALKACMHARRYQRSMLKIIAEVRRSTQESRLEDQLKKLITIEKGSEISTKNAGKQKATQTDDSVFCVDGTPRILTTDNHINIRDSPCSLSLEQKIEMFQERLHQEAALKVSATYKECYTKKSRRSSHNAFNDKLHMHHRQKHRVRSYDSKVSKCIQLYEKYSKTSSFPNTTPVLIKHDAPLENTNLNSVPPISIENTEQNQAANSTVGLNVSVENDVLEQDDEIAKELAQLFSEEKSELEELLGLNVNSEIDDPQVRSVFEEIENTPLSHKLKKSTYSALAEQELFVCSTEKQLWQSSPSKLNEASQMSASPIINLHGHTTSQQHRLSSGHSERPVSNLRHSLWPCELYMQRRRLTASLSRLIEEDFRWHDIIKWKFQTLFGEDSDDEFATCSPSIELDEILICSCIRRISPWMVKHLMKPMQDGLIANRFLFKKLAKKLAHSIVLENQYPGCVGEFLLFVVCVLMVSINGEACGFNPTPKSKYFFMPLPADSRPLFLSFGVSCTEIRTCALPNGSHASNHSATAVGTEIKIHKNVNFLKAIHIFYLSP
ncbi:uncharacterized protein LOC128871725 isoform X2 [Anastrepha ludens]|uniref:uncharacterized protein LOC128871725 isoform X2 n=1 Tax=Anastrepha ludens TaxID=28586 RepID=UPI0023B139B8|nr:uncharacterized protein LOC128871725 isoform X2 [Anastrepha ludens]